MTPAEKQEALHREVLEAPWLLFNVKLFVLLDTSHGGLRVLFLFVTQASFLTGGRIWPGVKPYADPVGQIRLNGKSRPNPVVQHFSLDGENVLKPDMRVNAPFVHDPYQKPIYTFALPVFST